MVASETDFKFTQNDVPAAFTGKAAPRGRFAVFTVRLKDVSIRP